MALKIFVGVLWLVIYNLKIVSFYTGELEASITLLLGNHSITVARRHSSHCC